MKNTHDDHGDTDPVEGIDQTNGLAGDLEGDDSGAEDPRDRRDSLLGNVLDNGLNNENPGDDTDAGYSEEGQP